MPSNFDSDYSMQRETKSSYSVEIIAVAECSSSMCDALSVIPSTAKAITK